MKKVERILAIIALIAFFMKILHLQGAAMLLTLSMGTLSMIYFFGFLWFENLALKDVRNGKVFNLLLIKKRLLALLFGYTISVFIISTLFTLMRWSGENIMFYVGSVAIAVSAFISFLLYRKTQGALYKSTLIRIGIISAFALLVFSYVWFMS